MAWRNINLSVGLISAEVALDPLIVSNDIQGNYVCAVSKVKPPANAGFFCGVVHEGACERVSGYPQENGTFVIPDKAQLDQGSDKALVLQHSCHPDEIDPLYFNKTYVIGPKANSSKAMQRNYWLLERVLIETNRAMYGLACLDSRSGQQMIVLRYCHRTNGLLLHVCHFEEEVAWKRTQAAAKDRLSEEELKITAVEEKLLRDVVLKVMHGEFQPEKIRNTRRERLLELIEEARAEAGQVATDTEPDLVEKMKQMVNEAQAAKPKRKTKTAA